MTDPTERRKHQVFVSHSYEDRAVAETVAAALRGAGIPVWSHSWELAAGDSILRRIDEAIVSSDVLLLLLSRSSVGSTWVQQELGTASGQQIRDRAITVIPALIEECDLPPALATRAFLDLRDDVAGGLRTLIAQLGAAPKIEFSTFDGHTFESLVADLLIGLGFSVSPVGMGPDRGVDFVASYRARDPFGATTAETWLVEVKFYREHRVTLSALQQLIGALATSSTAKKGLLVTNGNLTSVAREFLAEAVRKRGHDIRVIDGTELTTLLMTHPEIIRRHFPPSTDHE